MDNNAQTQIDAGPDGFRAVALSERAAGGAGNAVAIHEWVMS